MAARDLIPMRRQILEISKVFKIPCINLTIKCTLFEDNKGAEELDKFPKYRPRTKHIAIKFHHFREWVKNGKIIIKRVDTKEQEGDIFTKPFPKEAHEYIRNKFMGWCCILTTNIDDITYYENVRVFITGW